MPSTLGMEKSLGNNDIRAAHSNSISKGLNGYHFDCVAENLVATLTALAVPQDIIDQIVAIVGPLRAIFESTEV